MSDYTQNLHDPASETHLEDPLEDNDGTTSSGILLQRADYDSPEVSSLNSSTILNHPDDNRAEHDEKAPAVAPPAAGAAPVSPIPASTSPSTELSTAVVDLNQTMPWRLLYPFVSRETVLSLCKATAINFMLPFINGVFLGFGEICAHELTYRWGWTHSAHVVSVPGRRPANAGDVGVRAAGASAGSEAGTQQGRGYAGSRAGIGGLGQYEDEFTSSNRSASRQH